MIPEIETILNDPAASDWLKRSLRWALDRDPVDAAVDSEALASVLRIRSDEALRAMAEEFGLDAEALQTELWRDGDER
jgi:hypothetical protein